MHLSVQKYSIFVSYCISKFFTFYCNGTFSFFRFFLFSFCRLGFFLCEKKMFSYCIFRNCRKELVRMRSFWLVCAFAFDCLYLSFLLICSTLRLPRVVFLLLFLKRFRAFLLLFVEVFLIDLKCFES